MKVLVLTTTFPRWEDDSTPLFVYDLSRRLQERGLEIVILAPHHEGAKRYEIIEGMKVYRFPYFYPLRYQRLVYEGGILPNLKRSNLAKIQVPLLLLLELYYSLKIAKKEKVDVVHSHWIIPSGLIGGILRNALGIKHVLTIHAAGLFTLEKLPFKKRIADFIIKRCDRITVVSSYIYERLLNIAKPGLLKNIREKIEIIPMGVDTSILRQKTSRKELRKKYNIKSKNILLFLGRLAEKKGLKYLINAMPKIVSKDPDTELIICGDGPLRKSSEELVKKKGLGKYIRFASYSLERKIDYLSMSDIFIVPSIVTRSGDTEGMPVVIMEGLAAGKPTIASDVGGVRDAIKDGQNGFLVKQKKPGQIAEKALLLIKNDKLRKKFSSRSLETARKYDWKVISRGYEKVIRSVRR